MAKKRSKNTKQTVSPLNSSVVDAASAGGNDESAAGDNNRSRNGGQSERAMSATKKSEEAALTAMLFGGDGDAAAAWEDDDDEEDGHVETNSKHQDTEEDEVEGDLFAIDRSGEEVTDDVEGDYDEDDAENEQQTSDDNQLNDEGSYDSDEESEEEDEEENKASMTGAAWQDSGSESEDGSDNDDEDSDSDDESSEKQSKKQKGVSLADGPNRLKKLRRYRDETDPLSFKEYELRLRERFMNTSSVAARTDWADVGLAQKQQAETEEGEPQKKKKRGYASSTDEDDSSDDEYYNDSAAKTILQSNASLFETSAHDGMPLPPTLLNVVRTRDANLADPSNSVVNACQFHPGSDEDNPLLMTAGMDKMLRFFRINDHDSEENHTKIHGIHFPKMPITCASFLGDSGSVVLSGRRPFFYVYDAASGNIQKIPSIVGRQERSLEKFTISPDGRIIAFLGNDGYVILVDGKSKQWIGDLKMNGSVRAVVFSEDGEYIMGSGSDGDVYKWHIGSRRCVERFHNEDGTITSSLAVSSNFLAVGAESGVVNLYNDRHSAASAVRGRGLSLAATERTPIKSVMNMTTSADNMCFNHDGQILAMSSRRETNGLKLLHVPTQTVFSNWPTSKTPLKYVWSMDFSPGSKYLAVGNDHGKCLLYRLKHYWDE
mmetsp:Transcript_6459/g.14573  ORF Transcript_6459/g.14573 Transcript_6459/m.14573 type:complete len:659 (+) Transcript_6459:62-2038(+)|eukprot:CAMPEP_0172323508 /NCGR_PEP_ID=MMETSP1058-20130122/48900_1 /TAXON_ID=83371 /ORGANISM="Detonula confervacea, Strain CCMP 353" /LENGTH=658 /DNA_ID=CAMNT_0013039527 /DNA_START=89 /DNA_END=2065 /DNA_ORIENTATION=+